MSVKGSSSGSTVGPTTGNIHKEIKVPTPDPYHGERSKLDHFLLQCDVYYRFNKARFASETEVVLWATMFLKGAALNWIEGFTQDYLLYNQAGRVSDNMDQDTKTIFETYDGFKRMIMRTFGEVDTAKQAMRQLRTLKQKGSAATYAAEFQRHSAKTNWNDPALISAFDAGLKDTIKDALVLEKKPKTIEEAIDQAIRIDNRLYERHLEKKGTYDPKRNHAQYRIFPGRRFEKKDNTWPQPMELDATGRQEMSPQERDNHMKNKTCFRCGKPGHMARNCHSGKSNGKSYGRKGQLNATIKGPYNGPMQLNATRINPDEWEEVTQSMDAVTFVETEGNDVNSDSTDSSDEEFCMEPLTQSDEIELQRRMEDADDRHWQAQEEREKMKQLVSQLREEAEEQWKQAERHRLSNADDWETQYVRHIQKWNDIKRRVTLETDASKFAISQIQKIDEQARTAEERIKDLKGRYQDQVRRVAQADEAAAQDKGASFTHELHEWSKLDQRIRDKNRELTWARGEIADLKKRLIADESSGFDAKAFDEAWDQTHKEDTQTIRDLEETKLRLQEEIATYKGIAKREEHNIARIDHPEHGKVWWRACYTDSCMIHYSSKENESFFPSKRIPVYGGIKYDDSKVSKN